MRVAGNEKFYIYFQNKQFPTPDVHGPDPFVSGALEEELPGPAAVQAAGDVGDGVGAGGKALVQRGAGGVQRGRGVSRSEQENRGAQHAPTPKASLQAVLPGAGPADVQDHAETALGRVHVADAVSALRPALPDAGLGRAGVVRRGGGGKQLPTRKGLHVQGQTAGEALRERERARLVRYSRDFRSEMAQGHRDEGKVRGTRRANARTRRLHAEVRVHENGDPAPVVPAQPQLEPPRGPRRAGRRDLQLAPGALDGPRADDGLADVRGAPVRAGGGKMGRE